MITKGEALITLAVVASAAPKTPPPRESAPPADEAPRDFRARLAQSEAEAPPGTGASTPAAESPPPSTRGAPPGDSPPTVPMAGAGVTLDHPVEASSAETIGMAIAASAGASAATAPPLSAGPTAAAPESDGEPPEKIAEKTAETAAEAIALAGGVAQSAAALQAPAVPGSAPTMAPDGSPADSVGGGTAPSAVALAEGLAAAAAPDPASGRALSRAMPQTPESQPSTPGPRANAADASALTGAPPFQPGITEAPSAFGAERLAHAFSEAMDRASTPTAPQAAAADAGTPGAASGPGALAGATVALAPSVTAAGPPGSTAPPLPPSILFQATPAPEQVISAVRLLRLTGRDEIRLRLDPPDLGTVHVRVVEENGRLAVHLRAEHAGTADLLQQLLPQLRQQLQTAALSLESLESSLGNGFGFAPGHSGTDQGDGEAWGQNEGPPGPTAPDALGASAPITVIVHLVDARA